MPCSGVVGGQNPPPGCIGASGVKPPPLGVEMPPGPRSRGGKGAAMGGGAGARIGTATVATAGATAAVFAGRERAAPALSGMVAPVSVVAPTVVAPTSERRLPAPSSSLELPATEASAVTRGAATVAGRCRSCAEGRSSSWQERSAASAQEVNARRGRGRMRREPASPVPRLAHLGRASPLVLAAKLAPVRRGPPPRSARNLPRRGAALN
jgi:hypothetical protein